MDLKEYFCVNTFHYMFLEKYFWRKWFNNTLPCCTNRSKTAG